eukprot:Skav217098  [mRNA]  locus=scaffold187:162205:163641:+ [translate_table: standard]
MASEAAALIKDVSSAGDDNYRILGVDKRASDDEIKKAYRMLALRLHPDKCKENGAEEAFKRVVEAFSALSDADRRPDVPMPASRTFVSQRASVHPKMSFSTIGEQKLRAKAAKQKKNQEEKAWIDSVLARMEMTTEALLKEAEEVLKKSQTFLKNVKAQFPSSAPVQQVTLLKNEKAQFPSSAPVQQVLETLEDPPKKSKSQKKKERKQKAKAKAQLPINEDEETGGMEAAGVDRVIPASECSTESVQFSGSVTAVTLPEAPETIREVGHRSVRDRMGTPYLDASTASDEASVQFSDSLTTVTSPEVPETVSEASVQFLDSATTVTSPEVPETVSEASTASDEDRRFFLAPVLSNIEEYEADSSREQLRSTQDRMPTHVGSEMVEETFANSAKTVHIFPAAEAIPLLGEGRSTTEPFATIFMKELEPFEDARSVTFSTEVLSDRLEGLLSKDIFGTFIDQDMSRKEKELWAACRFTMA